MGVPSFQQLMLPALQTIGQRYDEISISGLEDGVSKALKISAEERQLRLPSGNQTLFANRLNWARSYLSKANLQGCASLLPFVDSRAKAWKPSLSHGRHLLSFDRV
jgi:restriction endonuclease Mrr